MRTDEEQAERLRVFMKTNHRIDLAKHQYDYCVCQAYLSGDKKAFQAVFEDALVKIQRYVSWSTTKIFNDQDREDIVSVTSGVAIEKMDKFKAWSRYSTWMRGIARNRVRELIRKKAKEEILFSYDKGLENRATERKIQKHQPVPGFSVFEMLDSLPCEQRLIVKYHAVEKWSFEEIATRLKIAESEVCDCYDKAISQLRRELLECG